MDKKTYDELMNYLVKGKFTLVIFQLNAREQKEIELCQTNINSLIFRQVANFNRKDQIPPLRGQVLQVKVRIQQEKDFLTIQGLTIKIEISSSILMGTGSTTHLSYLQHLHHLVETLNSVKLPRKSLSNPKNLRI